MSPHKIRIFLEIVELKVITDKTLNLMERYFSKASFDSMMHLIIHLSKVLKICGPVKARWCYPLEPYFMVLKDYVQIKACPEVSIALGYTMDEALDFVIEYFHLYKHSERRISDMELDEYNANEVLEGRSMIVHLFLDEVIEIHNYII